MDEFREEREELDRIAREDEDDAREQAEAFGDGFSAYEPLTEGPIGVAWLTSGRYA